MISLTTLLLENDLVHLKNLVINYEQLRVGRQSNLDQFPWVLAYLCKLYYFFLFLFKYINYMLQMVCGGLG